MFKKATLPALLLTSLVAFPLNSLAETNYYTENKKTYGITDSKSLTKVSKDIANSDYRDGSNSVNVGIKGGNLTLKNNSSPTLTLISTNKDKILYQVVQNGDITISDNRFTGEGWSLYLHSKPLTMVPKEGYDHKDGLFIANSGKVMYSGSAKITSSSSVSSTSYNYAQGYTYDFTEKDSVPISASTEEGGTITQGAPTSVNYPTAVPLDDGKIRIAYAYKGEGMGDWTYSNVLENVYIIIDDSLKQDKKAYPDVPTPYQTKFEWTLVSGPGNN